MADVIERVDGRGCVLRGDDIDTDRIIPARFLRGHGFRAFVAGSFAEIFRGNCTALGLPCITLAGPDLAAVMDAVEVDPEQQLQVDVRARSVTCRAGTFEGDIPDGAREQLLEGSWNATAVLLEAGDAIERCAAALPYVAG